MRRCGEWVVVAFVAAFVCAAVGQEAAETQSGVAKDEAEAVNERVPDQAGLEKLFRETMTDAVFQGSWQMTGEKGLKGEEALSEPKSDKYTISKVTKIAGDRWFVMARIEYGDHDVTVPVPVRVVWAGDTPVITLDKVAIPGVGTYSARVMVYGRFYCGTWFGDCYGGVMSGQIVKAAKEADAAELKKDTTEESKEKR